MVGAWAKSPKESRSTTHARSWREDLHVLANEVAQRHKNTFAYTSKREFDLAVAKLDKRISQLKGYEVMIGMLRILDAHPLAIDFRNNGGGDYIRFDKVLLEGLKQRAWLRSRGRLYALIG